MKNTASPHPRRVLPARLAGAAVAAITLAGSLLAAAPAGAAVAGSACPVVWTGTHLVTAALSAKYQLYAYEQVPGASGWTQQLVAGKAPDGEPLITVSMAATSSSVQIVAEDNLGIIWFFQQNDGSTTWSKGQQVGSVTTQNEEGQQTPQIAWTGVPGHPGTNSVITVADGSGNILMWYQNGGGWTQETVWKEQAGDEFYDATPTATDKGIVIVAPGSNGALQSFFQAYGPNPWQFDGSVGVGSGQSFDSVSVTWDGTNVDVAAAYNAGAGSAYPDELVFLWKSDSAAFWNDEDIIGPDSAEPFDWAPSITYTGSNLLLTAVQQLSATQQRLDSWWQGSDFTTFNFESKVKVSTPNAFGPVQMTYTEGASAPESAVTVPFTTNDYGTQGLEDYTIPLDSSTWTKHVVSPA